MDSRVYVSSFGFAYLTLLNLTIINCSPGFVGIDFGGSPGMCLQIIEKRLLFHQILPLLAPNNLVAPPNSLDKSTSRSLINLIMYRYVHKYCFQKCFCTYFIHVI